MSDDRLPEPEPRGALVPPRGYPPTAIAVDTPPPPPGRTFSLLRIASFIAIVAGIVGSLAFMRRTSPNMPRLLVVLIGLWVISPFVLLAVGDMLATRWPRLNRATIYALALVLAVASLMIYRAVAFGPPRAKPAFFFVLIPPVSWLVIATALATAALVSRKRRARPA